MQFIGGGGSLHNWNLLRSLITKKEGGEECGWKGICDHEGDNDTMSDDNNWLEK